MYRPYTFSLPDTLHNTLMREHEYRSNKSKFMRDALFLYIDAKENQRVPIDVGDDIAAGYRNMIATLLGCPTPPETGYPLMGRDAYTLAYTLSLRHPHRVRGGKIPMVPADAVAAGLDPDAPTTWKLYIDTIPRFFCTLFQAGTIHPIVVEYPTLDRVDGEGSGIITGHVISCETVQDIHRRCITRMSIQTKQAVIYANLPAGYGGDDIIPGMYVSVAGPFHVEDEHILVQVFIYTTPEPPGFDEIYYTAKKYGVSHITACQAVAALQVCHGKRAPLYSGAFISYVHMEQENSPMFCMLQMPHGWPIKIYQTDMRSGSITYEEAFCRCMSHWRILAEREEHVKRLRDVQGYGF